MREGSRERKGRKEGEREEGGGRKRRGKKEEREGRKKEGKNILLPFFFGKA